METKRKVRMDYHVHNRSIRQIARDRGLARNTVREIIRSDDTGSAYAQRQQQPYPKLADHLPRLESWLQEDSAQPRKQRRNAKRLFDLLKAEGYEGAYDSVQRYVKRWKEEQRQGGNGSSYIPLEFEAGDAMQFDWSLENVVLGGVATQVKVAHFRLCHSRRMFVVAFPREQLEMVLEAHNRAIRYFGGVTRRVIYDNPKTLVHKILSGRQRDLNRRFARLASHYLFEPVMCNPASGWEKGQVEKQVQDVRNWLFLPKPRFDSFDELNAHLQAECDRLAERPHPVMRDKSIAEVFAVEQQALTRVARPFESFTEHEVRATTTSLVRYDRHHYSIDCSAAGRPVTLRARADRIEVLHDGRVVAEHQRSFRREGVSYNPWHYLDLLERKPGALRDGAPFKQWRDLPPALQQMRGRLEQVGGGDRSFISLLCAARDHGLEPVAQACSEALKNGIIQAEWVLNRLAHKSEPEPPETLLTTLTIEHEPKADCSLYNKLLTGMGGSHAIH